MLAFRVHYKPGATIHDQVVFAAKRAMVCGQLQAGYAFPSVRILSKELKINPNTAHKVVATLVSAGLLEVRPGQGTFVTKASKASKAERADLLEDQMEELIVEAKRLGIGLEDLQESVERHWKRIAALAASQANSGGHPK